MASGRAVIWCAVSTGAQAEDERFSLPTQEADARALAVIKGWDVVDVMMVPGHSRRYKDLNALAEAAAKKNIDAFYRLQEHWERQDFDYLICRDGDRFARSQALFARITEEVIETAKARIWSLNDGLIDKNNYRMWIAMRGLQAASDVDKLVKYRDQGMSDRGARGLPVGSKVPLSHKLIRDEKGKAQRLEVNEDKRRLWDDLAALVIEGVGWHNIDHELYERFGHVDTTGQEYGVGVMYALITNPLFWGNSARFHQGNGGTRRKRISLWIFDESEPVPDGVLVWRGTVPPVYTGDQAEQVKAEIRRRVTVIRGRARPSVTNRYSGLFVCGECGNSMSTYSGQLLRHKPNVAYAIRCTATYRAGRNKPLCGQGGQVNYRVIQAYLDARLREWIDGEPSEIFMDEPSAQNNPQKRIDATQTELDELEARIGVLINEQSLARLDAQPYYRTQVSLLTEQADKLRLVLAQLKRKAASATQQSAIQRATLAEIKALTMDEFWNQPDIYINQMLHRIFGKRQIVILDKQFVGIVERRRTLNRRNSV